MYLYEKKNVNICALCMEHVHMIVLTHARWRRWLMNRVKLFVYAVVQIIPSRRAGYVSRSTTTWNVFITLNVCYIP